MLGIVDQRHWRPPGWPRFVLDALHRNVSLLVLAILAVHIGTSVLDSFAPIRLVDAVVPFVSAYRPIWLGLGALAFDLLLAVLITSVLRRQFGHRAWRLVHWLAYVSWPVAVVHGLATGTDAKAGVAARPHGRLRRGRPDRGLDPRGRGQPGAHGPADGRTRDTRRRADRAGLLAAAVARSGTPGRAARALRPGCSRGSAGAGVAAGSNESALPVPFTGTSTAP